MNTYMYTILLYFLMLNILVTYNNITFVTLSIGMLYLLTYLDYEHDMCPYFKLKL